VRGLLARLEHSIENADDAPTTAQVEAYQFAVTPLSGLVDQWRQLKETDLKSLNEQLKRQHLAILNLNTSKYDKDMEDELEMGDEE
jgi:hypothetical protein